MSTELIRNLAVIAHVDHGKTTLVDQMLYQSGMFRKEALEKLAGGIYKLIMDSSDLERERGITITAKVCSIGYKQPGSGLNYTFNLIDTPGHADFGGEVERVLRLADGCLLLVDAFEGPMPQTRFVLSKALQHGLRPLVVINKVDKPAARPDHVVTEVFDLLVELNAPDEALDFPIIYASGREGWAIRDLAHVNQHGNNLMPLFEAIVQHVPAPKLEPDAANKPTQLAVTAIDFSEYVGRVAIGRVSRGAVRTGQDVTVLRADGEHFNERILKVQRFEGLSRIDTESVSAGNLCAIVGLDPIDIGDTVACRDEPEPLPRVKVDEPTLSLMFRVNDSPFAGREGKYVTSRQIYDRLQRELRSNVAMRLERGDSGESFLVSGRGLMHLGVLLETMRREGYELAVGKPQVLFKTVDGVQQEPIERLEVDCPLDCQSDVIALASERRGLIERIDPKAGTGDYVHMVFTIPARGLIGMRPRMLNATQGRAVMHHSLAGYEPMRGDVAQRLNGVMVASEGGQVTAYSLDRLYDRGIFFVRPGDQVYEGMIVGEHCKAGDIAVNLAINKKLSNVRTTTADDQTRVRPPREMSLEASMEYIEEGELVEITPQSVRIRKRKLKESDRRKDTRAAKSAAEA